jgi:hypothetical protein
MKMALRYSFFRELMVETWERYAEPWCIKDVRPAFDGDVDAMFSLYSGLSNGKRGYLAVAMWNARVAIPAFRACLGAVWEHDHRELIEATKTRRRLGALFNYADFPKPAGLPDVVRVWRGTSHLTAKQATKGYSWTTNRDVACWFAVRFANSDNPPLVLAADVSKNDVALFHDGRNEAEAVIIRPVLSPISDGNPNDWRAGHARQQIAYAEALAVAVSARQI